MSFFSGLKGLIGNKRKPVQMDDDAKKVLIVEDDVLLISALENKFQHEGYFVLKAENGQVGLDTATAQNPDVIILDLLMPIMDGKTMLRKLREIPRFKSLPVIILTNAGSAENMTETQFYYNASSFLVKSSVTIEEIVEKVKNSMPKY